MQATKGAERVERGFEGNGGQGHHVRHNGTGCQVTPSTNCASDTVGLLFWIVPPLNLSDPPTIPSATLMRGLTRTCGLTGHSYPTPNCGPMALDVMTSVPSSARCVTRPIPSFR